MQASMLSASPTAPDKHEAVIYGSEEAADKARKRFLDNAVNAIRSGYNPGCKHAYRDAALSNGLGQAREEALLRHDVLVRACRRSGFTPY